MSEKEFNLIFSSNLLKYMSLYDMTQSELAKRLNVSSAAVNTWCKGLKSPRMDKIDSMCVIFNCKRSDLMEDSTYTPHKTSNSVIIPVLGRVAAGVPIEAVENIIDTEEITIEMAKTGEFFGLKIKGDSMEPRICDGDVVIVRKQEDADNGDVVIALVNGNDAVCKRLSKYAGGISLFSLNPKYEPMMYTEQDTNTIPVKIIGRVMELRGKF
ncbi:MAG: helix-turn-helix domain-containing protein [Lachnospiraceae bacterium]|nr:helix-turn-helix domain-containing protein [Lachnospiraceae bacterium]